MSMGQGMATWHAMRSFTQDSSVTKRKLAPGTVKRIIKFAAPYKRLVAVLLVLLAVDAALGAVTPLLIREILNKGIGNKGVGSHPHLVIVLALLIGLIAIVDAGLGLIERYQTSRIGEGLIFDMRARIFSHIQQMPIAFFTRTQTGALISRLNNDVLGAQQAFTSTLSSVVTNLLTVTFTLSVMFVLSWQITLAALALLPLFVLPARWFGRKLQTITRESYNLNAAMNNTMTERFNVAGALLVKLFGRPREEDAAFRAKAGRVRDIGVTQSMYGGVFFASLMLVASLGVALVYGWGGWLAANRELDVGTVVALGAYLTRLYGPLTALSNVNVSIMTALVSFERVFEVLDLPPMIDDAPDAVDLPAGANTIEFDHVEFGYPAASDVSLASLESVAVLDTSSNPQVLHDVSFKADAGQLVALVGPSGAGKTTISALVSRLYDVTGGAVLIGGADVRQVTQSSLRDTVGVVTQDSHMFHDTIRANLVYAKPDATDDELDRGVQGGADLGSRFVAERRPRHPRRRARVPVVRRREAAARNRAAVAQGTGDRRARRGNRTPRLRIRGRSPAGAEDRAVPAARRWSSRTGCPRSAMPTRFWSSTTVVLLSAATTTSCSRAGGLYAELYRTQFERQATTELG